MSFKWKKQEQNISKMFDESKSSLFMIFKYLSILSSALHHSFRRWPILNFLHFILRPCSSAPYLLLLSRLLPRLFRVPFFLHSLSLHSLCDSLVKIVTREQILLLPSFSRLQQTVMQPTSTLLCMSVKSALNLRVRVAAPGCSLVPLELYFLG